MAPACFCMAPNLGFTVHLCGPHASPGVIDFPRPGSLACTATIISKSIFCQPPPNQPSPAGEEGSAFRSFTTVLFLPGWSKHSAPSWGQHLEWFLDTDVEKSSSPGHIGPVLKSDVPQHHCVHVKHPLSF